MKAVVLYKSKSGFVKKYAEWIAEELSADLFEASKVAPSIFDAYDTVIYGGGLYAIGINGVKLITSNLNRLKGKKIAVFASGATPPREKDIKAVQDSNFTPEQLQQIKFFYLRGGFDYKKLKPVDKILMNLLKLKIRIKKREEREPDEIGMLAAYDRPMDFTKRKNIEELIAYVKGVA